MNEEINSYTPPQAWPDTKENTWSEYDNPWLRQEGGSHYKDFAIQPSDYIQRNKITWMPGNVIKLMSRYDKKGQGLEDLRKAKHYIELLAFAEFGERI